MLLQSISQKLMAGFVECLDCEDAEEFVRLEEGMRSINVHTCILLHFIYA